MLIVHFIIILFLWHYSIFLIVDLDFSFLYYVPLILLPFKTLQKLYFSRITAKTSEESVLRSKKLQKVQELILKRVRIVRIAKLFNKLLLDSGFKFS